MVLTDKELEQIGNVEILPRHKAEYEFDKRFDRTRPNQRIARVTKVEYYKCYSGHWIQIKQEDMTDI